MNRCERNNAKSQRVITDFFCVRRSERNGMTSVKLKVCSQQYINLLLVFFSHSSADYYICSYFSMHHGAAVL